MAEDTPYGGEFTVTLTGWERRQLALWVEDSIVSNAQRAQAIREFIKGLPKTDHERQVEWLKDLLSKLSPDD